MDICGKKHMQKYTKTRKVKLVSRKIKEEFEKRDKLSKEGQDILKDMQKHEKELNKIQIKIQKTKDAIQPLLDAELKEKIDVPYEIISRVYLDNGHMYAEIVDQVEEYKKALADKFEEDEKVRQEAEENKGKLK